jgi:molybdenum cofactor synthesis domain-containing protein
MEYKKIPVKKAVGEKIAHDMTQIIPDEYKGARFKKGYIIEKKDIPVLKDMGKESIYIIELEPDDLHEDEAAMRITKAVCGKGLNFSDPKEGKITLKASYSGIMDINKKLLLEVNSIEDILITSIHNKIPVNKGDKIAGIRINPLVINEKIIKQIEKMITEDYIFKISPFHNLKIGLVVTGNEVYYGRIEDKFVPTLKNKLKKWGGELLDFIFVPDNKKNIKNALLKLKDKGAEVLITGGGMSVDPDDLTPSGIKATGAEIITYGAPVLPGNKLMIAYLDNIPILGLPACVLYYKTTVFDLIYPRILAKEKITRKDIIKLSLGGFCRHCEVCKYPNCSFGKIN